jgi:adenosylmethionine-8-amino-7-oxononanoate aminotransferase
MGERLHAAIARGVGGLPLVGEVRSRGLLAAVDLVDPQARERPLASELVASLNMRAWRRGVIPFARGSVLRLAPPLCIDAAQVDTLAAVVCECIEELHGELARRPAGAAAARAG